VVNRRRHLLTNCFTQEEDRPPHGCADHTGASPLGRAGTGIPRYPYSMRKKGPRKERHRGKWGETATRHTRCARPSGHLVVQSLAHCGASTSWGVVFFLLCRLFCCAVSLPPPRLRTRHRSGLNLHTGRGLSMSALGQKQTYALQQAMSALPPIATAKAKFRKRPGLLYPRKDACAVH
jgi:hypothetical protein